MKRLESLSSSSGARCHNRGFSEPNTSMPLYLQQDDSVSRRTHLDNFELMTSTQLRDELRREKLKRRETEAELDSMKHPIGVGYTSPIPRHVDLLHTSLDSDSGISHSFSTRTKSPGGHSPLLMMSKGDIVPRTPPKLDGLSLKNMKDAMFESEKRRVSLMEKLRDAQETLQFQTDELVASKAMLNDKENTVQSLVSNNESLQQKIMTLQRQSDINDASRNEAEKKNEVLQRRVDELDLKFRSLQAAHSTIQSEHRQREILLEQTSLSLKLVEEENGQSKQTKDTMLKEALALRESLQISRAKCDKFGMELRDLEGIRKNCNMLMIKNTDLSTELLQNQSILNELRNQLQIVEGENKKMIQERDSFQSRAVELEETCSDLSNKLYTSSGTKERLVQEKVDLQQLLKYAGFEKEQTINAKRELEEKLEELKTLNHKLNTELRDENQDKDLLQQELLAVKKVGEDLSTELSTAKKNLEIIQEDVRQLQGEKKSAQQHSTYFENEVKRLTGERDSYSKSLDRLRIELDQERDHYSEQCHQLRDNVRSIRQERDELQTRCQELETKHKKANSDLHQMTLMHQEELDDWKTSCEELTENISEKNKDIMMLTERIEEASDKLTELHGENSAYRIRQEKYDEYQKDVNFLQEKLQELTNQHAEDQQVISLLEMQKNILSKNLSTTGTKLTTDHLKAEVERLKAELQLSQDKMIELRAEIDRTQAEQRFIPSCNKCEEYQESNSRLREINKMMTDRLAKMETHAEVNSKQASEINHFKVKSESLQEQIDMLQDLNLKLSKQVAKLELDNLQVSERAGKAEELGNRYNDLDEQNQTLQELNKVLTNKISRLELDHQSVNHAREKELFDQNQMLTEINQTLTTKVSRLEKEKRELIMKQPKEQMVPLKEFDRVEREKDRVISELEIISHDYKDLQDRHKEYVSENLSRTLDTSNTMPPESKEVYDSDIRKLKTENESLRRQNDLSHSQTVIAENARKRAEDRIHATEVTIGDLRQSIASRSFDETKFREQILKLEEEISQHVQKNDRLEYTITKLQEENTGKKTQTGTDGCTSCKLVRAEMDTILQEKDMFEEENDELKQELEQLESQLDIMQQDAERSVKDSKPNHLLGRSTPKHFSSTNKSSAILPVPRQSSFSPQSSPYHLNSDHKTSFAGDSNAELSPRKLRGSSPLSLREEVKGRISTERRQSQLKELILPSKGTEPGYTSSGSSYGSV